MRKIIIASTGASGSIYTYRLIKKILESGFDKSNLALVFSDNADVIWKKELPNININDFQIKQYLANDFFAPFASGSSDFNYMIICPCSMGTIGKISSGISNDLICRAADVMLKENRKLIIVPRETPYNLIHINNMKTILLAGGIICPASPSFYSNPLSIDELVDTVVDRVLHLSDFDNIKSFKWGEDNSV